MLRETRFPIPGGEVRLLVSLDGLTLDTWEVYTRAKVSVRVTRVSDQLHGFFVYRRHRQILGAQAVLVKDSSAVVEVLSSEVCARESGAFRYGAGRVRKPSPKQHPRPDECATCECTGRVAKSDGSVDVCPACGGKGCNVSRESIKKGGGA